MSDTTGDKLKALIGEEREPQSDASLWGWEPVTSPTGKVMMKMVPAGQPREGKIWHDWFYGKYNKLVNGHRDKHFTEADYIATESALVERYKEMSPSWDQHEIDQVLKCAVQNVENKSDADVALELREYKNAVSADDDFDGAGEGLTDKHLSAEVARDALAGNFHWCSAWGWMRWDGKKWTRVDEPAILEITGSWLLSKYREAVDDLTDVAGDLEATKTAQGNVNGWRATLSRGRISAITALAKGNNAVITDALDFDAYPDKLNCSNGVVDLRTGQLWAHDPLLLMTKITKASYRPGKTHPDWTAALEAIPKDVREWAQRRFGQGVAGYIPPDDVMVVQDGSGENGKTTIHVAIKGTLGDYFVTVSHRALLGDPSQHPTELMAFKGARMAFLEELPEERHMSVIRLKQVVGVATMKARLIRRDEVEWDCTHSLFLNTNHLPIFTETDHATWRRLVRIRFPFKFRKTHEEIEHPATDRRGDPNLRQRLKEGRDGQYEAVLAWLVEGAVRWYADDRVMPEPPAQVIADTKEWRAKSDQLMAYADEYLVFDMKSHVRVKDLLDSFNLFLTDQRNHEWSDRIFTSRIEAHDEFKANSVEKTTLRKDEHLSRPATPGRFGSFDVPDTYKAWRGIKFRNEFSEGRNAADLGVNTPRQQKAAGL